MDKNEWVSAKIKKLIDEGKSQEQAAAIAESMWADQEKMMHEPPKDEEDSEALETAPDDESAEETDDGKKKPDAEKALADRIWSRIQRRLNTTPAEDGTRFKANGDHWLAVWSNNFKDREGEIFTQKAIDAYVTRVDTGIVPAPALAIWHLGKKTYIGQADWVAREGHFLIAAGRFTNAPEKVKAYYRKHAKDTSLSHGFTYPAKEFDGKHYHQFNTFEISLLPRGAEANSYTSLERVKAMALDERKKKYLKDVGYSADEIAQMEADIDERGKALEAIQVEYKDFADVTAAPAQDDSLARSFKDLLPELIGADAENASANLLLVKEVKALKELVTEQQKTMSALKAFMAQTPRRASEAPETELDPEDEKDAAIIHQIDRENADAKALKAFPGLYNSHGGIDEMAKAQFNQQTGGR